MLVPLRMLFSRPGMLFCLPIQDGCLASWEGGYFASSEGFFDVLDRLTVPETTKKSQTTFLKMKEAVVVLERLELPKLSTGRNSGLSQANSGPRIRRKKLKGSGHSDTEKTEAKATKSSRSVRPGRKEKQSRQCPKCRKVFATHFTLNKHTQKDACDSNKSRLPAPYAPDRPHNTCYTFTCPICANPSIPTGGGRLEQHVRTHMNAEERAQELICCSTHHTTLKELGVHRKSGSCTAAKLVVPLNRPSAKKMSMCPVCDKVINSVVPNALKHHMDLVHARISKHLCDICGRPCPNQRAVQDHKVTHYNLEERKLYKATQARDYLCQLCGKGFYKKSQLKNHASKVHKIGQPKINNFLDVVTAQADLQSVKQVEEIETVTVAELGESTSSLASKTSECAEATPTNECVSLI